MRFEVSRVMDSIERRLTTDVTLAQAVVDLGEVARFAELDGGRPVNLLRLGIAVDALSRFLLDSGAMLYGIADRALLSEPAMTSKERMVLGRWLDDGLIEVTPDISDRAVEVADLTGLPLIAVHPYAQYAEEFRWLRDNPERLLRLRPRGGSGVLTPADGADVDPETAPAVAVGKATVTVPEAGSETSGSDDAAVPVPDVPEIFTTRGAQRISHTLVVRSRFLRADASGLGVSLMARKWRCDQPDCPMYGDQRRMGQPVPRMRKGVPACPRHGDPLRDIGGRPRSLALSIIVDDLARRRFAITEGQRMRVGVAEPEDDEALVISVGHWVHKAAAAWIGPAHVELELHDGDLVVTDVSRTGTAIWRRTGPDDNGRTEWLYGTACVLGEWDSVELYTGVELVGGDRRMATTVGRSEPLSVLVDAPTAALRQLT